MSIFALWVKVDIKLNACLNEILRASSNICMLYAKLGVTNLKIFLYSSETRFKLRRIITLIKTTKA